MKKIFLFAFVTVLVACGHNHNHDAAEAEAHEHEHEGDLIELEDDQAERFGVVVETITPGEFATTMHCSGVIERAASEVSTVYAPAAGIVKYSPGVSLGATVSSGKVMATIDPTKVSGGNVDKAAKAALEAAQKELDRITPLYQERLVTTEQYFSAVAAVVKAEAEYSPNAAGGTAKSWTSGVITEFFVPEGTYVEAGTPLFVISGDSTLTLHAEVPAAFNSLLQQMTDARIGTFTLSEHGGARNGFSSENGYACIYFNFVNDGTILPGSGVDVYLLGTPRQNVISVPLGAVTEQQGNHYVYTLHKPEHYEKVPVTLGASDGLRVEITSGLEGGEQVVTAGAMTVRLAESSGAIPEGHTHNH